VKFEHAAGESAVSYGEGCHNGPSIQSQVDDCSEHIEQQESEDALAVRKGKIYSPLFFLISIVGNKLGMTC
jgi:hypothetical protein